MMVFKRKQVVALSLVLMIVVAGYLQYSYDKKSGLSASKETGKIGEAVYVNKDDAAAQSQKDSKTDKKDSKDSKDSKATSASKQANDFFAQAKLDKEITRSRDLDELKAISDDPNAEKEAKAKAYDQRLKVIQNSEKELKIQTLLKEKGFNDVIALFGDDGSLDIVLKSPELTEKQIAQATDIITRQANVDIGKLHIKNMY